MVNNSSSSSVPGLVQPTQKAMVAGTPRDSAIASQNANNQKLNNLNNIVKGGKRKRGGAVVVPQYNMNYTPQNGPGQDPNSVIQQNSQISTQGTANAQYDSLATQKGGKKRTKRGGSKNPDWSWGCYSGGRTRRIRRIRRGRKSHKRSHRIRH
jgi:hypothetical protein